MNKFTKPSRRRERSHTPLGGFEFLESVSGCVDESITVFRPSQTPRISLRADVLHDTASLRWHKQNCETLHNRVLVDSEVSKFLDDIHVVRLNMWSNDQLTDIEGNKEAFATGLTVSTLAMHPLLPYSTGTERRSFDLKPGSRSSIHPGCLNMSVVRNFWTSQTFNVTSRSALII